MHYSGQDLTPVEISRSLAFRDAQLRGENDKVCGVPTVGWGVKRGMDDCTVTYAVVRKSGFRSLLPIFSLSYICIFCKDLTM